VKKRRTRALKKLMRDKQRAFRERHVGRTLPVLLELSRRNGNSYLAGWTDNYLRVELAEGVAQGGVVDVHIVAAEGDQLRGECVPIGADGKRYLS
jgi:tRNA A37 methylthiotransferase MiaB